MPVDHTAGSWKQGKNVIPEPLELKSTIPSRNAVTPGRHLSRQAITVQSICRLRRTASEAVVTQAATFEYALGAGPAVNPRHPAGRHWRYRTSCHHPGCRPRRGPRSPVACLPCRWCSTIESGLVAIARGAGCLAWACGCLPERLMGSVLGRGRCSAAGDDPRLPTGGRSSPTAWRNGPVAAPRSCRYRHAAGCIPRPPGRRCGRY